MFTDIPTISTDPPSVIHGIADPPTGGWNPLYDESITLEERKQAFAQWAAQYYPHKDLDKKDCHNLLYKMPTPVKPATFTGMSFEELLTKVDLTAGENGDYRILAKHFQPVTGIVRELSLFNSNIRSAWGKVPFIVLYGEESMYNIIWAVWKLEEESAKSGLPLKFKSMPGANHFVSLPTLFKSSELTGISRPCTTIRNLCSIPCKLVANHAIVTYSLNENALFCKILRNLIQYVHV